MNFFNAGPTQNLQSLSVSFYDPANSLLESFNTVPRKSIAHAVIQLEQSVKDYGAERRRVRVIKFRGREIVGGFHDYNIVRGGIAVHPRLVAAASRAIRKRAQLCSDLAALDTMLGGGLEEGTSTLIVGPPGTGKSSLRRSSSRPPTIAASRQRCSCSRNRPATC